MIIRRWLSRGEVFHRCKHICVLALVVISGCGGNYSLHNAIKRGETGRALDLIPKYDVNQHDKSGKTPLHWAASSGHYALVQSLLEAGSRVNAQCGKTGETPLLRACSAGNAAIVRLLVQEGADVNLSTYNGETPFHVASENGYVEIVDFLFQNGAQVNAITDFGMTPLLTAAAKGQHEVVKALIDQGARVDIQVADNDGVTPLMAAASSGNNEIVQLLLNAGASISKQDNDGSTVLMFAAVSGNPEVARTLIDQHAEVDKPNNMKNTPLTLSARWGFTDMVKVLVEAGANIDLEGAGGRTAVHEAALNGHEGIVSYLIEKGAKPSVIDNSRDDCYATALVYKTSAIYHTRQNDKVRVLSDLKTAVGSYGRAQEQYEALVKQIDSEILRETYSKIMVAAFASWVVEANWKATRERWRQTLDKRNLRESKDLREYLLRKQALDYAFSQPMEREYEHIHVDYSNPQAEQMKKDVERKVLECKQAYSNCKQLIYCCEEASTADDLRECLR